MWNTSVVRCHLIQSLELLVLFCCKIKQVVYKHRNQAYDLLQSKVRKLLKSSGLSEYVMWSEKNRHMVQNWYLELLVSCESLNHSLSSMFYLDLLWYWYQKLLMFNGYKKIRQTLELLISFILQTCDRFSQITSHIP